MRVSANFSKAASVAVLGAVSEATRVRLKRSAEGHVMFMPTARVLVNNLPKEEMKARKLTRDTRKGTVTVAMSAEGIVPGLYILVSSKFNWFTCVPYEGDKLPPFGTASVRFSKKTG